MQILVDQDHIAEILADPVHNEVYQEIIEGLNQVQKELPAKLFYDERGSELFEEITQLEEYYPTRTELSILQDNIAEIVGMIGPNAALIEYGSGSSTKTRTLLDHLERLAAYLPVDISGDYLAGAAARLTDAYPEIKIIPVQADYTKEFALPTLNGANQKMVAFFPGSTIGNFYPDEAVEFLAGIRAVVGRDGGLLIGVDLQKDPEILNKAYNDTKGITAEFNLNMLSHINREFGIDFCLERFEHNAFYNQIKGRIEMHLVSLVPQVIHVAGAEVVIERDETIRTEVAYKYSLEGFSEMADQAGFTVKRVWLDNSKLFSVQYLEAN